MGKSEIVGLYSVLFMNIEHPNLSQTAVALSQTLHSNIRIYLPVLIIFSSCYIIGWDAAENANDQVTLWCISLLVRDIVL